MSSPTWDSLAIGTALLAMMAAMWGIALRRMRRWPRVDAIVCHADEREAAANRKPQPRGWHVMFEGPQGFLVAQFDSPGGDADGSRPIGTVVPICYNPARPSHVMIVQGRRAIRLGLVFLFLMWLLLLNAVLRHESLP